MVSSDKNLGTDKTMSRESNRQISKKFIRIVSGGQTGVDRAALDAAMELKLDTGGWCPKGRRAEDGEISQKYPLKETPSDDYAQRTEWNVRDSNATLILANEPISGGTAFTRELTVRYKKPCLVISPDVPDEKIKEFLEWVTQYKIQILNVAGPRDTSDHAIYMNALAGLRLLLTGLTHDL